MVHCIHEVIAQKRWSSTNAIKDPSCYSGKSLICTFHAASGRASCGTNLPQSWDTLQDSRQLFIDPTESSLWFRAKVAKNFPRGRTEWVASSKQATVSPHLSRWSSRAASQVFTCHSKLFVKLCFRLRAGGNLISITNCSHYPIRPQHQRAWSGGLSGLAVVPGRAPQVPGCPPPLASPLTCAALACAPEQAKKKKKA